MTDKTIRKLIDYAVWAIILSISLVLLLKLNKTFFGNVSYYSPEFPFSPILKRDLNKYIKSTFPGADNFRNYFQNNIDFNYVYKNRKLIGFAKIIEKDIPCSDCKDLRFICGLDTLGRVVNIVFLNRIDLYGKPINKKREKKFIDQFQGLYSSDLISHEKVINITGATISCKYITDEIYKFGKELKMMKLIKNLN